MEPKSKQKKTKGKLPFPEVYDRDLTERKSVRTTFGLIPTAVVILKALARQHGITYKEIIDDVCQKLIEGHSAKSLGLGGTAYSDSEKYLDKVLRDVESEIEDQEEQLEEGEEAGKIIRKTYVVTKRSLRSLNAISEYYKISRDKLLSAALWVRLSDATEIVDERTKKREKALKMIDRFLSDAYTVHKKLYKTVGNEPVMERFRHIVAIVKDLRDDIQDYLEHNTEIDDSPYY